MYDACCLDMTSKGYSPESAARACAIATYESTGLTPGAPGLKKAKGNVTKRAEKIATSFSQRLLIPAQSNEIVRLTQPNAFDYQYAASDPMAADPFQPIMLRERGYTARMLREVFLIRTGTFNGLEFTEADLQALVDNWERPIPFQIDHSTAWRDNTGTVLSIRKSGKRVYGLAELIGWDIIDKVQSGQAKEVSIGFYIKPRKLSEVSWTQFPAVGGSDPAAIINPPIKKPTKPAMPMLSVEELTQQSSLSQIESQAQILTQYLEQIAAVQQIQSLPAEQLQTTRLNSPALEDLDSTTLATNETTQTKEGADMPEDIKPLDPAMGNFSASMVLQQMKDQMALIEKLQADNEAQKAQNAQLSKDVTETREVMKLQRNTAIVVNFAQKGLMLTANQDKELEFVSLLTDEALAKYKELKEANGPVIALGRLSTADNTQPGELKPTADSPNREAQKARLKADYTSAKTAPANGQTTSLTA